MGEMEFKRKFERGGFVIKKGKGGVIAKRTTEWAGTGNCGGYFKKGKKQGKPHSERPPQGMKKNQNNREVRKWLVKGSKVKKKKEQTQKSKEGAPRSMEEGKGDSSEANT